MESQQVVKQIEAECQLLLKQKNIKADEINAKMTRRIRDSGQECVSLNEEIRQLQTEIQPKSDSSRRKFRR